MSTLYKKVENCLKQINPKTVISDEELLVINRKDYVMNEVSPVEGFLQASGNKISYSFRMLLMLADTLAGAIREQKVKILIADESLWMAGFYIWLKVGGNKTNNYCVYAPKGIPKKISHSVFIQNLYDEFYHHTVHKPGYPFDEQLPDAFTFVIGNTKSGEQTMFAADRYKNVQKGVLLLKDYGKVGAASEKDYLEKGDMFVTATLEGNGYLIRL